jgi:hypothetical protein
VDAPHRTPDRQTVGEQRAERGDSDRTARVHTSSDQFLSKKAIGFAAADPNQRTYWPRTADRRAEGDIAL